MRNAIGFYEDFILGLYERKFLITDKSLMKNSVAVTKYAVLFTVYRNAYGLNKQAVFSDTSLCLFDVSK